MRRVPLAALAFATIAVTGLALALPLIAAFASSPRRAHEGVEPARQASSGAGSGERWQRSAGA
jgi:hypothetical protein